jgi:hypothetical protein
LLPTELLSTVLPSDSKIRIPVPAAAQSFTETQGDQTFPETVFAVIFPFAPNPI